MAQLPDGFDLAALLSPISGDSSAGVDLRKDYSPDFALLSSARCPGRGAGGRAGRRCRDRRRELRPAMGAGPRARRRGAFRANQGSRNRRLADRGAAQRRRPRRPHCRVPAARRAGREFLGQLLPGDRGGRPRRPARGSRRSQWRGRRGHLDPAAAQARAVTLAPTARRSSFGNSSNPARSRALAMPRAGSSASTVEYCLLRLSRTRRALRAARCSRRISGKLRKLRRHGEFWPIISTGGPAPTPRRPARYASCSNRYKKSQGALPRRTPSCPEQKRRRRPSTRRELRRWVHSRRRPRWPRARTRFGRWPSSPIFFAALSPTRRSPTPAGGRAPRAHDLAGAARGDRSRRQLALGDPIEPRDPARVERVKQLLQGRF